MKSLKGRFLVASPELLDPNFHQGVILMFEHNEAGAAGVVVNRPLEATITEVAEQVFESPFDWDKPIHVGGPVTGPLMILHRQKALADQEILPGLYSTVDAEKVREIIRLRVEPSLVVANYSGWGPGQLECELAEDSWVVVDADPTLIFDADQAELWEQLRSGDPAADHPLAELLDIPNVPEDPSLN